MKKKILTFLLAIVLLPCVLFVAACNEQEVKPTTLTSDMISIEYQTVDYDGSVKTPEVVVKVENTVVSNKEYAVHYMNNQDVGTATVLVKANQGSEVIKGSAIKMFDIVAVEKQVSNIEELKATLENANYKSIKLVADITIASTDEIVVPADRTINCGDFKIINNGVLTNNGTIVANVNSGERLVEVYQYANKAVLTSDIAPVQEGTYAGKIRLIAYKTQSFTLEMNGFDINSELDFVNYETTANRPTDVDITVVINNSAEDKVVIGDITKDFGICVMGYGEHDITLNNIKFVSNAYAISTNGYYAGATIKATNCEFVGTDLGAYLPAAYTYKFEDCKFEGKSAYYAKSGVHNLIDNEYKGTGAFLAPKHSGNGANPTGSALIVDSAAGYQSPLVMNIINGNFISENSYGVEIYVTGSTTPYSTVVYQGSQTFNVEKENIYSSYDVWDGTVADLPAEVETDIIEIETAEQLAALAKAVNEGNTFAGKTIKLIANLDLKGLEWTPIGYGTFDNNNYVVKNGYAFKGTFDGQGYSIYNLRITEFAKGSPTENLSSGVALFGNVVGGTIKNIVVNTANIVGNHYVAAIVGFGSGVTIDNCDVYEATINCVYADEDESGDKAGLILGYSSNISGKTITITNCYAQDSTVKADRDAGQLIGKLASGAVVSGNSVINVTVEWNQSSKDVDGYSRGNTGIKNEIIGG